MAPRRKGSFDVNAVIEPNINMALDARTHVRTKEERLDPESFDTRFIYKGLITASRDEEKLFFLLDHNNPQLEESWMEIGPYDDTEVRNLITQVDNRITNQTIQGGTGISVTRTGDNYTIVNTSQDEHIIPHEGTGVMIANNEGDPEYYFASPTTGIDANNNKELIATHYMPDGDNYQGVKRVYTTVSFSNGFDASYAKDSEGNQTLVLSVSGGGGGGGGDVNDDYMIISKTPNIIITSQGDSTANTFTYNASINGATADNNMLEAFTSGVDKIRIRGTSLATGTLTAWAASGAGIYYDSSTKTISYNNGTSAKSVVKIVDGSTVVPGDVEII